MVFLLYFCKVKQKKIYMANFDTNSVKSKYLEFTIGDKIINFDTPKVMGILNLTPDSFYDGGKYNTKENIQSRIEEMIEQKVDIIDVGAYSTRPGAGIISVEEEIDRLLPTLQYIVAKYPNMPISIDSFRSEVIECLFCEIGAFIVNDISGGTMDKAMYDSVAKLNLPYILMHIQGTPQTMQANPVYENIVDDIYSFFEEKVNILNALGCRQLIVDPGFGFGKTVEHNYTILSSLKKFNSLGFPVLSALSRKSMIYKPLCLEASSSLNGTTALNMASLMNGASILRVHDVKEAVETVQLFNLLVSKE